MSDHCLSYAIPNMLVIEHTHPGRLSPTSPINRYRALLIEASRCIGGIRDSGPEIRLAGDIIGALPKARQEWAANRRAVMTSAAFLATTARVLTERRAAYVPANVAMEAIAARWSVTQTQTRATHGV